MPLLAAAAVGGLASTAFGIYQTLHANHLAKKNPRPTYNVDPAFQKNLTQDEAYAGQGIPTQALQEYYKQTGRLMTQGVDTILQTGQGGNAVSSLFGQGQDADAQIAAADATQKFRNLEAVKASRLALAGENDKAWQINKFAPYADTAQLIAQEKTAGIENIGKGINSLSSGFANKAISNMYQYGGDEPNYSDFVSMNQRNYSAPPDNFYSVNTGSNPDTISPAPSQDQPIFNSNWNTAYSWNNQ